MVSYVGERHLAVVEILPPMATEDDNQSIDHHIPVFCIITIHLQTRNALVVQMQGNNVIDNVYSVCQPIVYATVTA